MVNNNRKKLNLSVFLLVFLSASFVITNDIISSIATILLWISLLVMCINLIPRINKQRLYVFLFLLVSMAGSTIINGENCIVFLKISFSYFVVLIIVSRYEFNEFANSFVEVMLFLSVISLIGYVAFLVIIPLRSMFLVKNAANNVLSNLLLYVSYPGKLHRNFGMFWEPGAYQTFLNLALMFEIRRGDTKVKKICIFIITILTTYSTTGYLGLAINFVILLSKREKTNSIKLFIIAIFVLSLFAGALAWNMLFGETIYSCELSVFSKLKQLVNYRGGNASASVRTRYYSVFGVLRAFLEKPILGFGYQGLIERMYPYTYGMNTCTVVNWFATYGIIYGVIMLLGVFNLSKRISDRLSVQLLVFGVFFIVTASENYVNNPFFAALAMYGYRKNGYTLKWIGSNLKERHK